MKLNDLLASAEIDYRQRKHVLVMRHRPSEANLRRVFPWLAAERPELFNAYQQAQNRDAEKKLSRAKYVASFIGHEAGKALFAGFFKVSGSHTVNYDQYWKIPENRELHRLGMTGFSGKSRPTCLWFDLREMKAYADWKGKLVIKWSNERAWCRWADSAANDFPIHAILEESALVKRMPVAENLILAWDELRVIPKSWRSALSQWRGVYLIFDASDGKGYVGSAYGADNIYSRWSNYAATGHGGNKELRKRASKNLRFSVLQLVSPQLHADDVIRIEASWKRRLHTREFGLNEN